MSNRAILRRLKKLETVFAVSEPKDDWIDVLMWNGKKGGTFGHAHYRFSESRNQTEWKPCSDEEEIAIMREHYEDENCRLYGRGSKLSFVEYLERFSYLGPEELAVRRKLVIERLSGGEDGDMCEDSCC